MRLLLLITVLIFLSCSDKNKTQTPLNLKPDAQTLSALLDTIWDKEQIPIRRRDSFMKIYGVDSPQYTEQQKIYEKNHLSNEDKIRQYLDTYGWPDPKDSGERGNWTICNVIQHSDNAVRIKYLPMMEEAVKAKKLEPRFLVRAADRIATEQGELQIYGGQMKFYPETKSFNVWPVFDPENIDKRRAEIGLGPIAEFLKLRFDFEWNLEEQIKRTKAFEDAKRN